MGKIKDTFYSYPKAIRILAVAMVVNTMGMSMLFPLNTLYITKVLNGTMATAGIILMIQQGFNILGNIFGGWSFDRFGAKRTIITGIIASTIIVFILIFIDKLNFYTLLIVLLGLSIGLIYPSIYAMAGALWPEGGRKTYNAIYVSNNLGVALGPVIGGIAFEISPSNIFIAYTCTFVIFLLIVLFGFSKENWQTVRVVPVVGRIEGETVLKPVNTKYINFVPLLILSSAFLLTWVPYSQWATSISFYMNSIGIEYSRYTLLWALNGLIIVLGQPLVAYITNNHLTKIKSQMNAGVLIFILSFIILYFNNSFYFAFVLAMIVITFGEMLMWPSVPTAAAELSPPDRKGFYQGVISGFGAGGRMFGVLLAGVLYDLVGISSIYLLMLSFLLLAFICFSIYNRFVKTSF